MVDDPNTQPEPGFDERAAWLRDFIVRQMDEYVSSTLFPQLEQRLGQWVPQIAGNVKSLLVAEAKAAEAERLECQ